MRKDEKWKAVSYRYEKVFDGIAVCIVCNNERFGNELQTKKIDYKEIFKAPRPKTCLQFGSGTLSNVIWWIPWDVHYHRIRNNNNGRIGLDSKEREKGKGSPYFIWTAWSGDHRPARG